MTDQRYIVVFGACLIQFTIIGFLFAYAVFIPEFQDDLGWSRTLLSAAAGIATFMMGTMAILGGRLTDRFGPRQVLIVTGLLYGLGIFLVSKIDAPWQLLLLFATLIAAGLSTHDVVTLSTVARWFDKRRGIMSGVIKLGTAGGQAVFPPLAVALILWLGWRGALEVIALLCTVLLVIAALCMSVPRQVAGDPQALKVGLSFTQARQTATFWKICAIQFLFFPTLMSVPFHMAVHGMDLGMTKPVAASLLSTMAVVSALGRIAVGTSFDRIGGKTTYTICLFVLLVSLLGLSVITNHILLFAAAAAYGFAHGGLFVVVSPTVSRYFGMRAHGALFGTVLFSGTIGGAVGPLLLGWVFDTWGSYTPAFLVLTGATALAIGLTQTLPSVVAKPTV